MSKEVFTLNPYKQVLLSEQEYMKLAELANANEALIEERAKKMYQEKGTASLGVHLYVQEGIRNREYEEITISNPMLTQTTELGTIPKESIDQINSAVREMLDDFYNENQRPINEIRKEYKKMISKTKFWNRMFCAIIFFGVICGLLQSLVFHLLK